MSFPQEYKSTPGVAQTVIKVDSVQQHVARNKQRWEDVLPLAQKYNKLDLPYALDEACEEYKCDRLRLIKRKQQLKEDLCYNIKSTLFSYIMMPSIDGEILFFTTMCDDQFTMFPFDGISSLNEEDMGFEMLDFADYKYKLKSGTKRDEYTFKPTMFSKDDAPSVHAYSKGCLVIEPNSLPSEVQTFLKGLI